jgi:hypothetical protein
MGSKIFRLNLREFLERLPIVRTYILKRKRDVFWRKHCDRRYMKSVVYPTIGNYLRGNETKDVLDIGAEDYNAENKRLFRNESIDYWVVDIEDKPKSLKCDHFLKSSITNVSRKYPHLDGNFDVIMSYGVLGFYKFDREFVREYLEAVYNLLRDNGIFLLKLDDHLVNRWEKEFQIDFNLTHKYFVPCSILNLPREQKVFDKSESYIFYVFKRRDQIKNIKDKNS